MALQMVFNSRTGVTHSESYWMLSQMNFNLIAKTGLITFNGYDSISMFQNGNDPVGHVSFEVTSDLFNTYFSPEALASTTDVDQCYLLAQADAGGFFTTAQTV